MRAAFILAALSAVVIAAAPAAAQTQEQVATLPPPPDTGSLGGGWETVDPAAVGIGASDVEPSLYGYEADLDPGDPGNQIPSDIEIVRPPEERHGDILAGRRL